MMNLKNILVAVDLREQVEDHALALAFELAAATDARVHLIHALVVRGASNLSGLPVAVVDDAAASAMERLKVLTVPYRSSPYLGEQRVRVGAPTAIILQAAQDHRADLIVLCGPHRTGVNRVLLGSVADDVLRQAPCPVLIARPTKV